jgi:hypothetical protein
MTTGRINQVALPPPPGGSDYINRLLYNPSSFGLFLTSMTFFIFLHDAYHTSPVFSPFRVNNIPEKKPKHTIIHVPKGGPFPLSLSLSPPLSTCFLVRTVLSKTLAPFPPSTHPAQDSVRPPNLELDMKPKALSLPCAWSTIRRNAD